MVNHSKVLDLAFKQTKAEEMVRAASTILFNAISKSGYPSIPLSKLAQTPQYGFTAAACYEEVGPKLVRITDIQDGIINWETVPYCQCDNPEKYLLAPNDILFARTGATTGKTYLVQQVPYAIFASYLIRLHPNASVSAEYLYSFFQSNSYWSQILGEKEGSAQPNVNGKKLLNIIVPLIDSETQILISNFLKAVRLRQDGANIPFPELPTFLSYQRRIVARIEELAARIEEARELRRRAVDESEALLSSKSKYFFGDNCIQFPKCKLEEITERITKGESPEWQGFSYQESGPLFIRSENVLWGKLDLSKQVHIPQEFHKKLSRSHLCSGDVLINLVGASIGRSCIVPEGVKEANINQAVAVISPDLSRLVSEYLMLFLLSAPTQTIIHGGKVETARPNISLGDLRKLVLPVPTLSEQHQIVNYLDSLQSKLDALKRLQAETAAELDALMPAVLDRAFRGEL